MRGFSFGYRLFLDFIVGTVTLVSFAVRHVWNAYFAPHLHHASASLASIFSHSLNLSAIARRLGSVHHAITSHRGGHTTVMPYGVTLSRDHWRGAVLA